MLDPAGPQQDESDKLIRISVKLGFRKLSPANKPVPAICQATRLDQQLYITFVNNLKPVHSKIPPLGPPIATETPATCWS